MGDRLPFRKNPALWRWKTAEEGPLDQYKKVSMEQQCSENCFDSSHISLYQSSRRLVVIYFRYISSQIKVIEDTLNHAIQLLHPEHVPFGSRRQHSQRRVLLLQLRCKLLLPPPGAFHACPFLSTPSSAKDSLLHSYQNKTYTDATIYLVPTESKPVLP